LAPNSNLPSVVRAISSSRVVPPVLMDCLIGGDELRSITLRVLLLVDVGPLDRELFERSKIWLPPPSSGVAGIYVDRDQLAA